MTDNSADMNWPTIVYKPIDEFNTEGLVGMCFPDIFLDGVGDPTITVRQRYITLANAGKKSLNML